MSNLQYFTIVLKLCSTKMLLQITSLLMHFKHYFLIVKSLEIESQVSAYGYELLIRNILINDLINYGYVM